MARGYRVSMPVWSALVLVVALVAVTVAAGVVWRHRQDRARTVADGALDVAGLEVDARGEQATLVLFSTEFCSRCPQVRRTLDAVTAEHPGVAHTEIDLTHRPQLAAQLHILQTPTVFVLDADGVVRSRFGGAPQRHAVTAELQRLIGEPAHV